MHSRVWGGVDFWSPSHRNHFYGDPLGPHIQDLRPWVLRVLATTDFVRGYLHSGPSALGILGSGYHGLRPRLSIFKTFGLGNFGFWVPRTSSAAIYI
jgi:hypothetical protein